MGASIDNDKGILYVPSNNMARIIWSKKIKININIMFILFTKKFLKIRMDILEPNPLGET